VKIPKNNSCKEKCLEKNSCSHYVRETKIRASKQQSTNSLEKKFLQRLNALKKNPAET
jgi:hypothetical protein